MKIDGWSFSSNGMFNSCQRQYWFRRVGAKGGWMYTADIETQKTYILSKLTNIYGLKGVAVESAINAITPDNIEKYRDIDLFYKELVVPFLNESWKQSLAQKNKRSPKLCHMREHYYATWTPEVQKLVLGRITDEIKDCLRNFLDLTYPFIVGKPTEEVATSGDPEHFFWRDRKIYAIPDHVMWDGDELVIIDYKSGKVKQEHKQQIKIYGLWAKLKYDKTPKLYLEYLQTGQRIEVEVDNVATEDYMQMEIDKIEAQLGKPKEEWEKCPTFCNWCNFQEIFT